MAMFSVSSEGLIIIVVGYNIGNSFLGIMSSRHRTMYILGMVLANSSSISVKTPWKDMSEWHVKFNTTEQLNSQAKWPHCVDNSWHKFWHSLSVNSNITVQTNRLKQQTHADYSSFNSGSHFYFIFILTFAERVFLETPGKLSLLCMPLLSA